MTDYPPRIYWHRRYGRLQLGLTVYRHRYANAPSSRWVLMPKLIWDTK